MKNFNEIFRLKAQQNLNTSTDHVILCAYKALNSKTNSSRLDIFLSLLERSFTPISNKNKLNNGMTPYWALTVLLAGNRLYNNTDVPTPSLASILDEVAEDPNERQNFFDIIREAYNHLSKSNTLPTAYYSYIVVEPTLSKAQQIVQAAHAAIELGFVCSQKNIPVDNLHLVLVHPWETGFITEYTGIDLAMTCEFFDEFGVDYVEFREPDLDNIRTAIATLPVAKRNRSAFKGLPLIV